MAKTVLEKLGYRPGMAAWAFERPDALGDILPLSDTPPENATFSIAFVRNKADVAQALEATIDGYRRGNHFWMAYPKKTGRLTSDISRDTGWAPLDAYDLLPVTQVALDEDWSALRFRYRDEIATLTRKADRS